MKKILFFAIVVSLFAACAKEVNSDIEQIVETPNAEAIENVTIVTDPVKEGAADRATCYLYNAVRYRNSATYAGSSAVQCTVKYRLMQIEIATGVETAVSPWISGTNRTGFNASWVVPMSNAYRYYLIYDQCQQNAGLPNPYVHVFWADDIMVQVNLALADASGVTAGPIIPANPDTPTTPAGINSSCVVTP